MRIGLFGYGKMGKMLEKVALERGHTIVAKVDVETKQTDYSAMDVAIDFSTPDAAFSNVTTCFNHGVPVISGTTGWLSRFDEAVAKCEETKSGFIYASNFSLGVNMFFELNKILAKMMSSLNEYSVSMEEIHHTQKLDAPSGTAIKHTAHGREGFALGAIIAAEWLIGKTGVFTMKDVLNLS
jgi:4-hydroxy-tetrahydrodipicolinate reductase